MSLVSKYKRGGAWYLRYANSIGLPRRSLGISDAKMAEAIRLNEEHKYILGSYGIKEKVFTSVKYSVFVGLFLQFKKGQGRSRNTIEAYRYALNNFGRYLKRDEFVHKISLDMLEDFAARRREANRSEKTVRNEMITLVTAFRWAQRQGYVTTNPVEGLELPRRVKYPPRYLRFADYLRLKACIDDEEFKDVVDFYLLTGIRRSEGSALRISEHIDLQHGLIILPQGKSKDYKAFPISGELRTVLERMLMRIGEGDKLIRYKVDNLTDRFGKYVRKAGLPPKFTFHSLRHTFGTWLAATGVNFSTIQMLMGQNDPDSTRIYVHAFDDDLSKAVERLKLPSSI